MDTIKRQKKHRNFKMVGIASLVFANPIYAWAQNEIFWSIKSKIFVEKLEDKFGIKFNHEEAQGLIKIATANPNILNIQIEEAENYQLLEEIAFSINPKSEEESLIKNEFLCDIKLIKIDHHDPGELLRLLGGKASRVKSFEDLGVKSEKFVDGGGGCEIIN